MPLTEQDHILIEKHLLQQLSRAEQHVYLERLKDADFKKEVDLQSDLLIAFKAEGRSHLKSQLKVFEQKIKKDIKIRQPKNSGFSIGRLLMIAASVVFLLFAGYWFLNQSPSNATLFAQYFEPYPNVVAPIDKGGSIVDPKTIAFQTYELKNYEEALTLFGALADQSETTDFYKGLCELSLGHPQKAIDYFDALNDKNTSFYYAGLWYKALALLKLDKTEEAIPLLENVSENASVPGLKKKAKGLLQQLEN